MTTETWVLSGPKGCYAGIEYGVLRNGPPATAALFRVKYDAQERATYLNEQYGTDYKVRKIDEVSPLYEQ